MYHATHYSISFIILYNVDVLPRFHPPFHQINSSLSHRNESFHFDNLVNLTYASIPPSINPSSICSIFLLFASPHSCQFNLLTLQLLLFIQFLLIPIPFFVLFTLIHSTPSLYIRCYAVPLSYPIQTLISDQMRPTKPFSLTWLQSLFYRFNTAREDRSKYDEWTEWVEWNECIGESWSIWSEVKSIWKERICTIEKIESEGGVITSHLLRNESNVFFMLFYSISYHPQLNSSQSYLLLQPAPYFLSYQRSAISFQEMEMIDRYLDLESTSHFRSIDFMSNRIE